MEAEALDTADDRLIRESGTEARVAGIILAVLAQNGFRLVRVKLSGQNGLTLQIMAERPDGTMTVEDCETVSRAISPVLDEKDPIEKAYHLEVSSPGIDRPLVRVSDFSTWANHVAKLETSALVAGKKKFRGRIVGSDESGVKVERDVPAYGEEPVVTLPFESLSDARLVLTDELIRESLNRDKKAREAAKRGGDQDSESGEEPEENEAIQE